VGDRWRMGGEGEARGVLLNDMLTALCWVLRMR